MACMSNVVATDFRQERSDRQEKKRVKTGGNRKTGVRGFRIVGV